MAFAKAVSDAIFAVHGTVYDYGAGAEMLCKLSFPSSMTVLIIRWKKQICKYNVRKEQYIHSCMYIFWFIKLIVKQLRRRWGENHTPNIDRGTGSFSQA